jgi:hypothetical protein
MRPARRISTVREESRRPKQRCAESRFFPNLPRWRLSWGGPSRPGGEELLRLVRPAASWWGDGKDIKAAGRAPVHPVREAAHLGVPALAGVRAHSVGQGAYLAECLQDHPSGAAAVGADGGVAAVGLEFVLLTRRADKAIGGFHAVSSCP